MITTERIEILLEYVTKGVEKANESARKMNDSIVRQQRRYQDTTKIGKRMIETTQRNSLAQSGFFKVMKMNKKTFGDFNEQGFKFTTFGGRFANKIRMMTHGVRGFRMEMLGVMFFGMMLYRTFTGLIKTSLEWMGVNEILSESLGLLFLPIGEFLLGYALKFLKWVTNLTEVQKKLIGFLVLGGIAFGGLIFIIGTFALGIGSLIIAFGSLLSPIGLFIAAITTIAGYALFKEFFDSSSDSVDKLKDKLVYLGVSGEVFDILKDKIIKWYNIVKNYLFGNEETGEIGLISKIKNQIYSSIDSNRENFISAGKKITSYLIEGIKRFFEENPLLLVGAVVGGLTSGPIGVAIGSAVGLGLGKIDWSKVGETMDAGLAMLDEIIKGILDNMDRIEEVIFEIVRTMTEWVVNNIPKFMEIGLKIAGAIIGGLAEGLLNVGANLGNWISSKLGISTGDYEVRDGSLIRKDDFVWRPGSAPVSINPNDTLIGFKGTPPNFGGGNITVSPTYNVIVSDKSEFERMLEENNRQLTEDVRRMIAT